ncbi:unnamed protein product [Rotaria magnacalcarata]|uniref:Uncharacterized protein n=2 Tax=Rotaria magnacalcarata TaxID=392030 RepID=A0A815J524_9BILA|nr:unnamed protein product [Rotaria magnacalcarata]
MPTHINQRCVINAEKADDVAFTAPIPFHGALSGGINRALTASIPRTPPMLPPSTITRILNTEPTPSPSLPTQPPPPPLPMQLLPTLLQPAKPSTMTPYTRFIMKRMIFNSNPAITGVIDVGGITRTDNEDKDDDEDSLLMAT